MPDCNIFWEISSSLIKMQSANEEFQLQTQDFFCRIQRKYFLISDQDAISESRISEFSEKILFTPESIQ